MHPAMAHIMVEQRMQERVDAAASYRLSRNATRRKAQARRAANHHEPKHMSAVTVRPVTS